MAYAMPPCSGDPQLRNQFKIVVGSLENILTELQEVTSDLRVVVNQIDDVTTQIEKSHRGERLSTVSEKLSWVEGEGYSWSM